MPSFSPQQKQFLEAARQQNERLCREHPLDQLFWECTLRCNMSCKHCGSDCAKDLVAAEMPLDDFLAVLDEVATHVDPESVLVQTVGGEPLVRHDIVECGREIKRRGFQWGMVTNGYLLDEKMMDALAEVGIDSMAVDIDGTRNQHNWLRNNDHSFDRAMRAIEQMKRVDNLEWDVITCVNSHNINSLDEIKHLLIDAGVKQWRCFTIIPMGRASGVDELQLTDEQFRDLLNFIVKTRLEGKIDLNYACEGFLGAYEGLVRDYFYTCDAGLTVASIRADGSISGCLSIRSDYNQGNIYRDSFWEVWNNRFDIYRNRDWMKRGICADCDMFRYCRGNGFHLRDSNGDLMLCHYNRLKNVKL
jgi:radical SAM enzyme (rSAM/lipoprotein system)